MADETDTERASRIIDRSIERHEKDAATIRTLITALKNISDPTVVLTMTSARRIARETIADVACGNGG